MIIEKNGRTFWIPDDTTDLNAVQWIPMEIYKDWSAGITIADMEAEIEEYEGETRYVRSYYTQEYREFLEQRNLVFENKIAELQMKIELYREFDLGT